MSIKLLPASVNPGEPPQAPDVAAGLVRLAQRAITTQAGQTNVVPSGDTFEGNSSSWSSSSWSARAGRSEPPFIDATPVEDSKGEETGGSGWEYISGWARSGLVATTAVAHYLLYAAGSVGWSGQLVNLYA